MECINFMVFVGKEWNMQKKLLFSGVVFLMVCLCGSIAPALTLMGQPTASLGEGQLSGAVEYTYSKMDVDIEDLALFVSCWTR